MFVNYALCCLWRILRRMKLIIGLGNPEQKYEQTRHNIGFTVIDWLSEQTSAPQKVRANFKAIVAEATVGTEKVLFVKPTTYYNNTGESARAIVNFYKLDPSDVLIIHDELALPLGTLRVRIGGSDAGNNGIRSLNQHLGTETARLRIGMAHPDHLDRDKVSVVLGKLTQQENDALQNMKPAILSIVTEFINGTHEVTTYKHD